MENQLTWSEFNKVDMRIGTIISAKMFKQAKKPAYILHIDFGKLGIKKSSAKITNLYATGELIGKQIIAVVNFPPKQIANIKSECLVLAGLGENENITLIQPERHLKNGTKIG